MKYKYRVVFTGYSNHLTNKGIVEHRDFNNQPTSWCKTAENAEKCFLKGIKDLREDGNEFVVFEYHIEKKEF